MECQIKHQNEYLKKTEHCNRSPHENAHRIFSACANAAAGRTCSRKRNLWHAQHSLRAPEDGNVPAPRLCLACSNAPPTQPAGTRRWRNAPVPRLRLNCLRPLRHSHHSLVGSPCLRSCSTTPSLAHSIQPSNWRSLHCSRMVREWSRSARSRCPGQGTPCRAPCSTMPSCPLTSLPPC